MAVATCSVLAANMEFACVLFTKQLQEANPFPVQDISGTENSGCHPLLALRNWNFLLTKELTQASPFHRAKR